MLLDEIIRVFPLVASVIGERWLQREQTWAEEYISDRLKWYEQLERDLRNLEFKVGLKSLTKCYGSLLRDKTSIWTTIHEIHSISLVAVTSTSLELHVPRNDSGSINFDARACIEDSSINMECKTRKDDFPFNLPAMLEGPERIPVHSGSRATLDPHDAADLGLPFEYPEHNRLFRPIPASTEERQILLKGLAQLPAFGCNLILFGELGFPSGLDEALFGTELFWFKKDRVTGQSRAYETRVQTGAFCSGSAGESFRQLSGVLWFKLFSVFGPEYKLYLNPNAAFPVPDDVVTSLQNAITQRTTAKEEN